MNLFNIFKRANVKSISPKKAAIKYPKAFLAGQSNRLTYSWTNYKQTADEIIERYLPILVARSCEQTMNNPYAKKFLLMLKNNVVGPYGIQLNAQSKDTDGTLDKFANEAIEKSWDEWGKTCDITGKLDWLQMQNLAITTVAREGEVLIRIIKGKYAGPWGFALQIIDPRRLDFYKNEKSVAGENFIRFGIEFNPYGKPLNYYIKQDDDLNQYNVSVNHEVIPADEIIHLFLPEYIDQKRGIPWFSTVLMRMNMLQGFEDAAVDNARAGACKMGFITNTNADDVSDEDTEIEIESEPASWTVLPPGWETKEYNPAYPSNEFDPFSKAILRGIASGLGASYNNLANDLTSVNFSSLRSGTIEERDGWKSIQQWFYRSLHARIFEEWLKYSLLVGMITLLKGGKLKPERIDKHREVSWIPRSWQWVDPAKDTAANIDAVNSNLKSRSDVIRESGRDPEEVFAEIHKENELLKSLNVNQGQEKGKQSEKILEDTSE